MRYKPMMKEQRALVLFNELIEVLRSELFDENNEGRPSVYSEAFDETVDTYQSLRDEGEKAGDARETAEAEFMTLIEDRFTEKFSEMMNDFVQRLSDKD